MRLISAGVRQRPLDCTASIPPDRRFVNVRMFIDAIAVKNIRFPLEHLPEIWYNN